MWPAAAGYIWLQGDEVVMHRMADFETALAAVSRAGTERRAQAAAREAAAGSISKRADARRVRAGAQRDAGMWKPRGVRLRSSAIVYEPAEEGQAQLQPSSDPQAMLKEVRRHRVAIFNAQIASEEAVRALLHDWGKSWRMHGARLPCMSDVQAVLERAPRSALGPDGLPYSVWAAYPE